MNIQIYTTYTHKPTAEYILFQPIFQICQSYLHVQNNTMLLYSSQVKCDFVELNLRGVGVMTEILLFKSMEIQKVKEGLILLRVVDETVG